MEIIYRDGYEVRFKHTSGGVYEIHIGGCGEAGEIFDASHNEVSVIPLELPGILSKADLELAESVITSISLTKQLKQLKQMEVKHDQEVAV